MALICLEPLGLGAHEKSIELWQRGRAAVAARDLEQGLRWVTQAAEMGLADAMNDLARHFIFDFEDQRRTEEALKWLNRALDADQPAAHLLKSQLCLSGVLAPLDEVKSAVHLHRSAQKGHRPALRSMGLLLSGQDDQASTQCFEMAAAQGDAVAMGLLARRIQQGVGCQANPELARSMFTLLANQGRHKLSSADRRPLTQFWQPRKLDTIPDLPIPLLSLFADAPIKRILCPDPAVHVFDKVFSDEECEFIRLTGLPYLHPSKTYAEEGSMKRSRERTSNDAVLFPPMEDPALLVLQSRMCDLAELPLSYAESAVVLRYQPGQEYFPHRDYLPPSEYISVSAGGPGDRQKTAIAYLNPVQSGGSTRFPDLNLEIEPEAGSVLIFENLSADGKPKSSSIHTGEPVRAGEKWIMTLWIRQATIRNM